MQSPPSLARSTIFIVTLSVHLVLLSMGYYTSIVALPTSFVTPISSVIYGNFGICGLILSYACIILRVSKASSYICKNSWVISFTMGLGLRTSFVLFRGYLPLGVRLSTLLFILCVSLVSKKYKSKLIIGLGRGILFATLVIMVAHYLRIDFLTQIGVEAHCSPVSGNDLIYHTKEVRECSVHLGRGFGPGPSKFDVVVSIGTVVRNFLGSPVVVTDLTSPHLSMAIKKCTTLPERIVVVDYEAYYEAYLLKKEFLDLPLSVNFNLEESPRE